MISRIVFAGLVGAAAGFGGLYVSEASGQPEDLPCPMIACQSLDCPTLCASPVPTAAETPCSPDESGTCGGWVSSEPTPVSSPSECEARIAEVLKQLEQVLNEGVCGAGPSAGDTGSASQPESASSNLGIRMRHLRREIRRLRLRARACRHKKSGG
jgi:hypothetical protein